MLKSKNKKCEYYPAVDILRNRNRMSGCYVCAEDTSIFFFITILSLIIFFLQSTRHLFFLPSVILKLKLMFLVCRGVVSCSVDSQTSDEPLVVWNLSRQRKQNVCHYVTV